MHEEQKLAHCIPFSFENSFTGDFKKEFSQNLSWHVKYFRIHLYSSQGSDFLLKTQAYMLPTCYLCHFIILLSIACNLDLFFKKKAHIHESMTSYITRLKLDYFLDIIFC